MGRQAREAERGSVDRGIGQFRSSEVERKAIGIAREHPDWVNSGGGSRKGNWVQLHQELGHTLNRFEGREPADAEMSTPAPMWVESPRKLASAISHTESLLLQSWIDNIESH